jgi:hypothetical protein
MSDMLCKDCKHCKRGLLSFGSYALATCRAPQNAERDLVTGTGTSIVDYCVSARIFGAACGPIGKWFEAKQVTKGNKGASWM